MHAETTADSERRHAGIADQDRRLAIAVEFGRRLLDGFAIQFQHLMAPGDALADQPVAQPRQRNAVRLDHRAIASGHPLLRLVAAMDRHRAVRHGQFGQRWPHPHVESRANGADQGGSHFHVERPFAVGCHLERGLALDDPHLAAMAGKADFHFAVAVEVDDRSVVQRDIANFAKRRLIAVDAAEGADGDDSGKDEEQDRDGGGDHDVARQAALLLFADDLRHRRQGDIGGGALEALGRIPCGFGTGKGYGMAWVAFDPVANLSFFLGCRLTMKLSQQARGFRFDRVPGTAA